MRENRYTALEIVFFLLALVPPIGLALSVAAYFEGDPLDAQRYLVLALLGLGFALLVVS
jgi:hypothetical protein